MEWFRQRRGSHQTNFREGEAEYRLWVPEQKTQKDLASHLRGRFLLQLKKAVNTAVMGLTGAIGNCKINISEKSNSDGNNLTEKEGVSMKRFQRWISGVVALCLVISIVPVSARAEETAEEAFTTETVQATTMATEGITVPTEVPDETTVPEEATVAETYASQEAANSASGTCGENATWTYADGVLTISGSGWMSGTAYGNNPWKDYNNSIVSAVVEEGITAISSYAFCGCNKLTSASLPNTLREIGYGAFYDCTSLTEIVIPDTVTSMRGSCFYGCNALVTAVLPESLTTLESSMFASCRNLVNVTMPGKLQVMRFQAFSGCSNLVSIDLPDTLTTIEYNSFANCGKLESVTLPESLISIGSNAFSGCDSLTAVHIPASVQTIERGAFGRCDALQEITVEAENACYISLNGILYTADRKTLLQCPGAKTGYITIPDSVISLERSAFADCAQITGVTVPSGVTILEYRVFDGCRSLENIVLPDSLTAIGEECFERCDSLKEIDLPETLTSIGESAFRECESLQKITLPKGITRIEDFTFCYCESLTEIEIPDGVTSIGEQAFSGCAMSEISLPENLTDIGRNAFSSCDSLEKIVIPDEVYHINNSVFMYCENLSEVILPEDLTGIGVQSFWGTALTSITIPGRVTSIDTSAFYNSKLQQVRIPASVTFIGDSAFGNIDDLETIIFEGSAPEIEGKPFAYITATAYYPANNATWTESVRQQYGGTITWKAGDGSGAAENLRWDFDVSTGSLTVSGDGPMGNYVMSTVPWRAHREEIQSVIVEEGITTVGAMTFCNFPKLTSVSLPSTLTSVENNAFAYSSGLTSITIPSGVTEIGKRAFLGCWRLDSLTIPGSVTDIGDEAFQGCSGLKNLTLGEGLLVIGVNAFSECDALTSVTIPASVTHIGDGAIGSCAGLTAFKVASGNLGYCAVDGILYDVNRTILIMAPTAITGVCNVPDTVREIKDKAFWRCVNLQELVFTGTMHTIGRYAFYESAFAVCYPREDAAWQSLRGDYGGSITWVPVGLLEAEGSLHYLSSATEKRVSEEYAYEDAWLYEDADEWNGNLARISLRMSLSGAQTKSDDIETLYGELGFEDTTVWYPVPTPDTVGYIIGSKMMRGEEDTESALLVAVTVRGGGYGAELTQDFRLGMDDEHSGYSVAADQVVSAVRRHIEATGVKHNIKIWITGFGRGGSIANIAAHRFNVWADNSTVEGVSRENIYGYCFGNANVVQADSPECRVKDENIFNLINPADYTSALAPGAWGYVAYGNDLCLPTRAHSYDAYWDNFGAMQYGYYLMMLEAGVRDVEYDEKLGVIKNRIGEYHWELPRQGEMIRAFTDAVAWICMDQYAYTQDTQEKLIGAIRHQSWDMNYAPVGALLDRILELLPEGKIFKVIDVVMDVGEGIFDCFTHAHYPEYWVAWLDAIEDDSVLEIPANSRYVITNCPVDLEVYDSDGVLVAQFVDDVAQKITGKHVHAYLDGNGQKVVILPVDEEFTIRTTATGDGTVSYQMQEYDLTAGAVTRVVDYLDIPIEAGDELTCTAGTSGDYTVVDPQGNDRVPDSENSGVGITTCQLTVHAEGNGTVTGGGTGIANTYLKISAAAAEDSVFAGWYDGAQRVSIEPGYRVRLDGDSVLTAKFVSKADCAIAMREYIVLAKGETVRLAPEVCPDVLTAQLRWRVEEGGETVVSVDESGTVTALNKGTAYVIACISDGEEFLTGRCRIDVAAPIELEGIQLSINKLTTELYSTDYAEFDILLKLPQNFAATATATAAMPESKGVAITSAKFEDPELAGLFDLVTLDDRTVAVVPNEKAVWNPDLVGRSYISAITVTVQGEEYTSEALTLTVKKTLPKLKAAVPAFNNFWSGQTQEITVTGATVTGITCENLPDWLNLYAGELSLNENVPVKGGSAKLTLLVETEEWAVPIETTLAVKCSYKAPGLKLSASSIQLAGVNSDGVKLQLLSKDKKVTLSDLGVSGISAPDGYAVDYNAADGTFVIKAESGFQPGKINLEVGFHNTSETVAIPLTVKVMPVALKLAPNSITLNSGTGDSAAVTVTATPADYRLTAPDIRILDAAKQDKTDSGELKLSYENGRLSISTTDLTPDNAKYTLYISAEGGKEAALKISTTNAEPTLKLKAAGSLDLSFPDRKIGLTTTFKNHSGGLSRTLIAEGKSPVAYKVMETVGKDEPTEKTDAFILTKEGSGLFLSFRDTAGINVKNTYTLHLTLMLENGKELESSVKIPVKQTNISLKLSANKLTLNKAINDKAAVIVTCATKDYNFTEPVWTLLDSKGNDASGQLDISWSNGKLTVATTEATPYGRSYKLQISPEEGAKAVTLAIAIPAEAKSTVTGTLKTTGNLDVIRDGTALTITPTWKNCNDAARTEELKIFCGDEDVTNRFVIEEEDGKYILSRGENLDHSQKYTATLTATFANGETAVATGDLKLKMGSVKLTLKADSTTLFANDKHSRVSISFASADTTLNKVAKVTLDPKLANQFEIIDYKNGQYAIGFKDGNVPAKLTSANISLNVWLEGNEMAKANASLKVKLSIIR